MALATALYGFLGLLISFRIARKYVDETWALLATLAIWWASSLPVYMYFNPSWSHAHSAFVVALFLWYWHETRDARTLGQWILLGALAGLMLNVYYANLMLFVILPFEALRDYGAAFRKATPSTPSVAQLLARHAAFAVTLILCLLPTFIAHRIIYGSVLRNGLHSHQPVELELAQSFLCPVFLESRIDFVDAGSAVRRDRALCFLAQRAARWRSLSAGGSRVLLFHRFLSGLGGNFFLRKPLFCFAHPAFYSGARRFSGPLHAHLSNAPRRSRRGVRFSGLLCFLECRTDVSVGYAPHSRARPDFFFGNDSKPIYSSCRARFRCSSKNICLAAKP